MKNTTAWKNGTEDYDISVEQLWTIMHVNVAFSAIYIVVGIPLCVWFVWCILSSPEMRSIFRYQLICAVLITYNIKSVISGILEASIILNNGEGIHCSVYTFEHFFRLFSEFTTSWMVVVLLFVYLTQLLDFDPSLTLTPLAMTLGKVVLSLLPFTVGVIVVPSVAAGTNPYYMDNNDMCMFLYTPAALMTFAILDYVGPIFISIVLLAIASYLYYRRFHHGFVTSPGMRSELVGRGPKVDFVLAYVAAVCTDLIIRLPSIVNLFPNHLLMLKQ